MQQKRTNDLTEFLFNQTKQFRQELQQKYTPYKWNYFYLTYQQLTDCYHQNITKDTQQNLNSDEMLRYYSCYKNILKKAKQNNKHLYDQSLAIEVKLKQCIEIKSSLTKSTFDFESDRKECFNDFTEKYKNLYQSIFNVDRKSLDELCSSEKK